MCTPSTRLAQAIVVCVSLIAAGCGVGPRENRTVAQVHADRDVSASFEQARLRMRAMVHPMSGAIVASADGIIAGTNDRAVRRAALLWKLEAVPAFRESLFLPRPMGALAETWVLTFQMIDYFEQGPGDKALGEAGGIALAASRRLEGEMARVAASMTHSGDVSGVRQYAREWAAAHPITRSIAGRETFLSDVTQQDWSKTFSVDQAVGDVMVTMDDLNRRVEVYSAQLMDQARWQAELFAMDMAGEYQLDKAAKSASNAVDGLGRMIPAVERSLATLEKAMPMTEMAVKSLGHAVEVLDRTIPALERSLAVVEKSPGIVTAEREAALEVISAELTRTIDFAREERIAAFKQITLERTAAVRDMGDTLIQERKLLSQEVDATAVKLAAHASLRAAQLCAASLVAVFLAQLVLLLIVRRMYPAARSTG